MRLLRTVLCWGFLLTCLENMIVSVKSIPNPNHRQHGLPILYILLFAPAFSIAVSVICGVAWWTVWQGERSARGWAIAASLMFVLIFFRQFVVPMPPVWDRHVEALFIGIVGLVEFSWYPNAQIMEPSWKSFLRRLRERDVPLDLSGRHQ
jgi:hypothetical protein